MENGSGNIGGGTAAPVSGSVADSSSEIVARGTDCVSASQGAAGESRHAQREQGPRDGQGQAQENQQETVNGQDRAMLCDQGHDHGQGHIESRIHTQHRGPLSSQGISREEQLRNSIVRVSSQIERTKKELDCVCQELRVNFDKRRQNSDGPGSSSVLGVPGSTGIVSGAKGDGLGDTVTVTDAEVIRQARRTVDGHIKMLTRYNEVKDVAMGLLGMIADHRGVRLGEVLRERDVVDDDP